MEFFIPFLFILYVIYYVLMLFATVISPIMIANNLMINTASKIVISVLGIINTILIVCHVFIALSYDNNPFLQVTSPLIWIVLSISLISYVTIFVNMIIRGEFKKASGTVNPLANIIIYGIEFLLLLLPATISMIINKTIYNEHDIMLPYFKSTSFYIVLGMLVLGAILNFLFRDTRKTIPFDLFSQILYFALSIYCLASSVMAAVAFANISENAPLLLGCWLIVPMAISVVIGLTIVIVQISRFETSKRNNINKMSNT